MMEGWKESEIGNLPENWTVKSLKESNSYKNKNINPSLFPNEIFEYYSIPAFQNGQLPEYEKGKEIHSNKLLLEPGSIVFGKLNPRVEKVWRIGDYSEHRKIGTTEWIILTPKEFIDSEYLYFLQWSEFVMPIAKTLVSGSTPSRQRVDPASFYKLKIPVPPLPEQRKISYVLSTVQKAIEQQDKLIRTTTDLKKALMQKLFTKGTRGEPIKPTEFGLVPESWEVVKINEIFDIQQGKQVSKSNRVGNNQKPFLRTINISWGEIDFTELDEMHFSTDEETKFTLIKEDLLVCEGGDVGRTAIWDYGNKEIYYQNHLHRLRAITNNIIPRYFLYWMMYIVQETSYVKDAGNRTTIPNLSKSRLGNLYMPLPNIQIQKEITETLVGLDRKIAFQNKKKQTLTALFKTLLHELMTGQRRVHELEFEALESQTSL